MMGKQINTTGRRGAGFWVIVVLSLILSYVLVGMVRISVWGHDFVLKLWGASLFFGLFCILFEIETLVSAKKLDIPEEHDWCRKVSYVLCVILSFIFPAATALRVVVNHLNVPAIVLALMLSYGVFAGVAFIMLLPFGNNCRNNIILEKKRGRKSCDQPDYMDELDLGSGGSSNWLSEKKEYGPDRLTIIDEEDSTES